MSGATEDLNQQGSMMERKIYLMKRFSSFLWSFSAHVLKPPSLFHVSLIPPQSLMSLLTPIKSSPRAEALGTSKLIGFALWRVNINARQGFSCSEIKGALNHVAINCFVAYSQQESVRRFLVPEGINCFVFSLYQIYSPMTCFTLQAAPGCSADAKWGTRDISSPLACIYFLIK